MSRLAVLAAIIVLGGTIALAGRFGFSVPQPSSAEPIAESYSPELRELDANTILHTVFLEYRRHGSLEVALLDRSDYRPETVYVESWLEFDERGEAASLRTDTRGADGKLYEASHTDGEDQVLEYPDGTEKRRQVGLLQNWSLESYKTAAEDGYAKAIQAVDNRPADAKMENLRGVDVWILESRTPEQPSAFSPSDGLAGYVLPYTGDLPVAESITRYHMSALTKRQIRYERAVVDSSAIETVIESSDELLVEVLPR